MITILL